MNLKNQLFGFDLVTVLPAEITVASPTAPSGLTESAIKAVLKTDAAQKLVAKVESIMSSPDRLTATAVKALQSTISTKFGVDPLAVLIAPSTLNRLVPSAITPGSFLQEISDVKPTLSPTDRSRILASPLIAELSNIILSTDYLASNPSDRWSLLLTYLAIFGGESRFNPQAVSPPETYYIDEVKHIRQFPAFGLAQIRGSKAWTNWSKAFSKSTVGKRLINEGYFSKLASSLGLNVSDLIHPPSDLRRPGTVELYQLTPILGCIKEYLTATRKNFSFTPGVGWVPKYVAAHRQFAWDYIRSTYPSVLRDKDMGLMLLANMAHGQGGAWLTSSSDYGEDAKARLREYNPNRKRKLGLFVTLTNDRKVQNHLAATLVRPPSMTPVPTASSFTSRTGLGDVTSLNVIHPFGAMADRFPGMQHGIDFAADKHHIVKSILTGSPRISYSSKKHPILTITRPDGAKAIYRGLRLDQIPGTVRQGTPLGRPAYSHGRARRFHLEVRRPDGTPINPLSREATSLGILTRNIV